MGFKEVRMHARENARFQAIFDRYSIRNGELRGPFGSRGRAIPIGGTRAEVDVSDSLERTTFTRVAAGAIIAGPVGAVVGGMFKKQRARGYLALYLPDGSVVIVDFPKADAVKAGAFAAKVNAAGAWYAEHEFGDGSILSPTT